MECHTRATDMAKHSSIFRTASDCMSQAALHTSHDDSSKLLRNVGDFLMSTDDLVQTLRQFLPRPPDPGQPSLPLRLRDAEFMKVAKACEIAGKIHWARRPRTFVVCYMIGRLECINDFVASDIALPYALNNLPQSLVGGDRQRFLDYQENVLTGQGKQLQEGCGEHQHIHGDATKHFFMGRSLGKGSFGVVDFAFGRLSLTEYALKRTPRGKFFKDDREKLSRFENELTVLKKLSHRHLVKLVGSYTDINHVGLLMTPVADMNLKEFLELKLNEVGTRDRCHRLRCFFGCISTLR